MLKSIFISEGWRFFKRRLRVAANGLEKKEGTARQICKTILDECFINNHFVVSRHNFQSTYCRDLGWCAKQLLALGYKKELISTLHYMLDIFSKQGIKVAINGKGKAFNFPNTYSIDSVAYLFYTLSLVKDDALVKKYISFLKKEAVYFYQKVIDEKTGLVKKGHFSAMRDHSRRTSSCYDNVMAWLMQQSQINLGITTELNNIDFKSLIKLAFWNGSYFMDDLHNESFVADANIYPFWFGLYTDKKMLKLVIQKIREQKLDEPFPLKYVAKRNHSEKYIWYEFFVKNWESNSIWPQMGFAYIEILKKINKTLAKKHFDTYTKLIEKHKTFLEVYDAKGQPYKSLFYYADEGLMWTSMYLYLNP